MFEINATLPIFLLMFFAFMYLLKELVLKPVGQTIEARKAIIQKNLEAGSVARTRGAEIVTEYTTRIHAANAEAQALINEAQGEAQKVRQKELSAVQTKGQAQVTAAKEAIAAERSSLVEQLVVEEQGLVESIAKKLIGDSATLHLDAGTVRRALEEAR